MKKRLISILLIISLMHLTPVVFAEKSGYDVRTGEFTICGESDLSNVSAVILPYDKAIEEITAEEINSSDNIVYKIIPVKSGEFKSNIVLKSGFPPGRYMFYTENENMYLFKAAADVQNVFNDIKSSSKAALPSVIYSNKEILGLWSNFFDDIYNDVISDSFEQLVSGDVNNFYSVYARYEGIERVKRGSISASEYFSLYQLYIPGDIIGRFNEISAQEKTVMTESIKNLNAYDKTYDEFIDEAFFVAGIRVSENYADLKKITLDYCRTMGIELPGYDSLYSYKQDDVFINMMTYIDSITSQKEYFEKLNHVISSLSSSNKGSASARPGKAVENVSVPLPNTAKEENKTGALSDIKEHWAEAYITELYNKGIVNGMNDAEFCPDNPLTRAELVKMVQKVVGFKDSDGTKFADVNEKDWFYKAVYGAVDANIVSGVDDNHFMPNNNVSREDACVIIYRAVNPAETGDISAFTDEAEISDYAKKPVSALFGKGIIQGSDGKFLPKNSMTRAEASVMIYRVLYPQEAKKVIESNSAANAVSKNYGYALNLLNSLCGEEFLKNTDENKILSRSEFVKASMSALNRPTSDKSAVQFSDVNENSEYAKYVYGAFENGYIESSEGVNSFNPDDEITYDDALYFLFGVCDIRQIAENLDGRYYEFAKNIDFLKNINDNAAVTKKMLAVLLYNILNAQSIKTETKDYNTYSYVKSDKLYVEKFYNLKLKQGIIRETSFNAFDTSVGVSDSRYIKILDDVIGYDEVTPGLLGQNVRVYYEESTGIASAVIGLDNEILSVNLNDSEYNNGRLMYYEEERQKYARLSQNCFVVLNGRTEKRSISDLLGDGEDDAILIDNNKDGIFDIIHIESPEYAVVSSVDRDKKLISDKNDNSLIIDLSKALDDGNIVNERGEKQTLYNITRDNVIEVKRSFDEKLVSIKILDNNVIADINSIHSDETEITLEGKNFKTTKYFNKWYKDKMSLGNKASFTIAPNGYVVCLNSESDKKYGYVIKCFSDDSEDKFKIRLLTQNNDIETLELAQKILLDGDRINSFSDAASNILLSLGKTVISYKTNPNAEIISIDTPLDYDGTYDTESLPDNNNLLKYAFPKDSIRFRSAAKTFSPYFNISDTVVFKIPTDTTDEKYFLAAGYDVFQNGEYYSCEVFDLNEDRTAGAVVNKYNVFNPEFVSGDASYVVERISEGINDDDEKCLKVDCWANGSYQTITVNSDISVKKANNQPLAPGDVIRVGKTGNNVSAVMVDYYLDGSIPVSNTKYSSAHFDMSDEKIAYVSGMAYKKSDDYILLTSQKLSADTYDTSFGNLKQYSLSCGNVVKYDTSDGKVRPVSADEIKEYISYGAEGDYIVIRQNYDSSQMIIIFD
ncbi:MAG: S-layer homology domain-containing protein [Clostridia bacterium]|nr:S-layer homology domain-containing protein [Clostridia bacterium]